jgi:hypothetical protein
MAVFVNRFPEYSAVFAGLVVDARERGGTPLLSNRRSSGAPLH